MLKIRKSRRRKEAVEPDSFLHHATFVYVRAPTELPSTTEELYRAINKVERDIGGDSGLVGMSGSVARLDLSRIFAALEIGVSGSHLLDVGSGLGRPMMHGLLAGASLVSGIEFDAMKHGKSQTVISRVLPLCDQVRTCCHQADVLNLKSFSELDNGFTHLFSFWEGINMDAREAVARLVTQDWNMNGTISSVAFVQEHVNGLDSYMLELGFPKELQLVDTFQVSMIGSASRFRAYIFKFTRASPVSTVPDAGYQRCTLETDLGSKAVEAKFDLDQGSIPREMKSIEAVSATIESRSTLSPIAPLDPSGREQPAPGTEPDCLGRFKPETLSETTTLTLWDQPIKEEVSLDDPEEIQKENVASLDFERKEEKMSSPERTRIVELDGIVLDQVYSAEEECVSEPEAKKRRRTCVTAGMA